MNKRLCRIEKVLLLNPFVFHGKNRNVGIDPVVSRHVGQEIKTGITFPLGLASMGAMLLKAGFMVRILDPIAEIIRVKNIYRDSEWADAIIIPFSPAHQSHIRRYFNDFHYKLRIFCGGIASSIHEYLFKNNFTDIILVGEPEETIVDLVQHYPDLSFVKGIVYRTPSGGSIMNKTRPLVKDLDSLPFPIRNFSKASRYWDISFYGKPTAWVLPTRGCLFNCIFCAQYDINQKTVRKRSPKNFVDEIEQVMKEQNVRNFVFFDETFNLDSKYTIAICEEILKRNVKIQWWCPARPDFVCEDVARKMKESGCVEMRFGLESANDEILKYLKKDTTVKKIRRGIEITKKVGINFSLQCIVGSPMETEETLKNTLSFIHEVKPLFVSFNILTPLPGSYLFRKVKDKLDLVNGLKNFDILHTDYPLGDYSSVELSSIVKRAYLNYYLSLSFLTKVIKEFFKRPKLCVWITKTLFDRAFYIYSSVLKR